MDDCTLLLNVSAQLQYMSDLHTFHWLKQVTCQCLTSRSQGRTGLIVIPIVTDILFISSPEAIHLRIFTYVVSK